MGNEGSGENSSQRVANYSPIGRAGSSHGRADREDPIAARRGQIPGIVRSTGESEERPSTRCARHAARVKTRLPADPAVSGLQIDVDTRDRIVTLTGA